MASELKEQIEHIKARLNYLKARRTYLREDIPILEKNRDWADVNASAQTWYHANVKVNAAKRELKKVIAEIEELERKKIELKMKEEWKV